MSPAKINFKIYQGTTFRQDLRWESETKVYVPITSISKSAPIEITVADPVLLPPVGWRVRITNVQGMKEINMPEDQYQLITDIDNNIVILNQVNSIGYTAYTSGGVLEYNSPVKFTGYAARMQIRKKLKDPEVVLNLTTENGGIVFDEEFQTISINITAEQTALLNFTQAVYDLEFITVSGTIIRFAEGNLILKSEVTRNE